MKIFILLWRVFRKFNSSHCLYNILNIYVKLYLLYVLHKYAVQVLQYKYLIQYFIETHYEICIKLMKLIENDSSFC